MKEINESMESFGCDDGNEELYVEVYESKRIV